MLVVVLVLSPAVTSRDSFPISTYPMYAFERSRVERFEAVLGEAADGTLEPISARVAVGTIDPLIAEARVAAAIRTGTAGALCVDVAHRVEPGPRHVLVVHEVHDVVLRASGEPSLRERVVHARCAVPP